MPPRASALHDLSAVTARYRRRHRDSSNSQPEDRHPTPTPQGKSRPKKRPTPLSLDPTEIIPGWEIYRDPSTESLVPENRPEQPPPESNIEPGPTIRRSTPASGPSSTTTATAAATVVNDGNMAGRLNFLRLVMPTITPRGGDEESIRVADRIVQTFNDVLAAEKAREAVDRAAREVGGAGANVRTAAANQAEFIERLQARYEVLTLLEEGEGSQFQAEPRPQPQPQLHGYGLVNEPEHGQPPTQPQNPTSAYVNPSSEASAATRSNPYSHSTYHPTAVEPQTSRPPTTPTHYNYTSPPTTLPYYMPSPPPFSAPLPTQQIIGPSSDILSRSAAAHPHAYTHATTGARLGVGPGPTFAERVRVRARKRARLTGPDPGLGADDDGEEDGEDELRAFDEMVIREAEMEYANLDWSGGHDHQDAGGDAGVGFATATATATADGGISAGADITMAMPMQMRTQDPWVVYAYTHTYPEQQQQQQQQQQQYQF